MDCRICPERMKKCRHGCEANGACLESLSYVAASQPEPTNQEPAAPSLEQLAKDAARYRWLREKSKEKHDFYSPEQRWMVSRDNGNGTGNNFFGDKIDEAIDAAMTTSGPAET